MSAVRSLLMNRRRIHYRVRVSRAARKARIRVNPAGVEVVLPADAAEGRAEEFLRENIDWVIRQLAFVKRFGSIRRERVPMAASSVLFRGRVTPLEVVTESSRRRFCKVVESPECLRLYVPSGVADPMRSFETWLRRRARAEIETRLEIRRSEMRQRPGRVYVMGQRTKWGGCSGRRNLSFNWRLVMAPPDVLDYIVVHELAHLAEPNHSARFWLTVRSYCPDYELHNAWLRDHGDLLWVRPTLKAEPAVMS